MRRLDGITDGHVHTMDMSLSKLRETVQDGGVAESDSAERLNKATRQSEAVSEGLWGPLSLGPGCAQQCWPCLLWFPDSGGAPIR